MASNRDKKGRFFKGCSQPHKGRGKLEARCLVCSSVFYHYKWQNRSGKFCSLSCYHSSNKGEVHPRWASNPAYTTVHNWVHRTFGFPTKCENCSFSSHSNRKIHWANKSGNYKREREDWMRLCVPCHKNYDLGNLILT